MYQGDVVWGVPKKGRFWTTKSIFVSFGPNDSGVAGLECPDDEFIHDFSGFSYLTMSKTFFRPLKTILDDFGRFWTTQSIFVSSGPNDSGVGGQACPDDEFIHDF